MNFVLYLQHNSIRVVVNLAHECEMHWIFYLRTGNHVVIVQQSFCATDRRLPRQAKIDRHLKFMFALAHARRKRLELPHTPDSLKSSFIQHRLA